MNFIALLNLIVGWLGFTILSTVVAGMIVVFAWSVFHSVRQIIRWPKAEARVLRYWIRRSEGKSDGQRFYFPVLKFQTNDDRIVTTISTHGSWRRPWPIGTNLPVRYDPKNPKWVEIASFASQWGLSLTLICIFVFWIVFQYYSTMPMLAP